MGDFDNQADIPDQRAEENFSYEDIMALKEFDPFAPKSDGAGTGDDKPAGGAEGGDGTPAPKPEGQQPPKTEEKAPPAPKTEDKAAQTGGLTEDEKAELELLREANKQLKEKPVEAKTEEKPKTEEAKPTDTKAAPKEPDWNQLGQLYNYTLPDEFMALMEDDDPSKRKMGLGQAMRAMSMTIHARMEARFAEILDDRMKELRENLLKSVPAGGAPEQVQQMQSIRTDFYTRFKDLDKPEIMPIVAATAEELVRETGTQKYTPAFGNVLASRVRKKLRELNADAFPNAGGAGGKGGGHPPMFGGNTRGTSSSRVADAQQAEVLELIGGAGDG